ncbi:MAG: hypothetical protein U1G05_10540 [Kiritimatiellia bacterium]
MTVIANVIFPAFTAPYMPAFLFPPVVLAVLLIEAAVFRRLNRTHAWGGIVGTVLYINGVSGIVGFMLAGMLPSGLEPVILGEGANQFTTFRPGPRFETYAVLGILLAFLLSILFEWGLLRVSKWGRQFDRPFATVALANVASYATLILAGLVWGLVSS